jgi:hypothetical protein
MNFNSDFRYDLKIGVEFETKLYELLGKTIEVKRDFKALNTGNIFIEYQSRGKLSGIATTQAKYWCYWLSDFHLILIETEELKKMCRIYLNTKRDVCGGDNNTSKGVLLPLTDFIKKLYI